MKFAPALCLAALTSAVYAVDPLVLKGTKFFNKNTGDQFFFKGVAYQPQKGADPTNPDPLADTDSCKRDIAIFKELGLNAIRVYDVDSSKNHDACMKALDDAGIYVVLDVPNSDNAINRAQPSWDVDLFNHYKQKIDAFIGYDNLAAFIIGNEVTNDLDTTEASAYVKAAARDIKNYIKTKSRYVPLGYADNDDPTLASNLVPFFNCGDSADARIDFYGINTYRWCGDNSSFKTSGYDVLTNEFKDFSIPVIMTEYGCNKPRPRHFHEIESIYGPDMQDVFSGGFMYEYSEEDNEYGIVKVQVGSSDVKHTGDFESFKNMTAKAKPQGVKMSSVSNSDSKP
ncbi:1 3-beta-glucanosyltransferase gel4, partial [Spiromyces aspiralis]